MPSGTVVGIDQVVWDTLTNTLHVESDAPARGRILYFPSA